MDYYGLLGQPPDRARLEELVDAVFVLRDEPVSWRLDGREQLWRLIEERGGGSAGEGGDVEFGDYVGDAEAGTLRWTWRVSGSQAGMFGAPMSEETATMEGVAWVRFRGGRLLSLTELWASDYIITTAVGNHPGLAHIPRGAGAVGQYEHYYPPGAVRNNSIFSHSAASDPVLNALLDTMLQTRDFEEHRLAILEAQEYESGLHYFTPSQQGAAGTFLAFQSNLGNVTDYVVRTNSLNAALEYPHYFKRA